LQTSEPNKGSTFVFYIQVNVPANEDIEEELDNPEKESATSGSDKNILSLSEFDGPPI